MKVSIGNPATPRNHSINQLNQRPRFNRFDQVPVKPRLFRTAPVIGLPPAGAGHHGAARAAGLFAYLAACFVAIEFGHADVEQYDVRVRDYPITLDKLLEGLPQVA